MPCSAVQVVFHAERGLEWVALAQKHQHACVTALFKWSCATVTVGFYATFLPALICAMPPRACVSATLCLVMGRPSPAPARAPSCSPTPPQPGLRHRAAQPVPACRFAVMLHVKCPQLVE